MITPGPWTTHGVVRYYVVGADGQHVADTHTVDDARLIAAAPALLEALERFMAFNATDSAAAAAIRAARGA